MVSTRFFLTLLPLGGALAQEWNGWAVGPDDYVVTETITNTKTVCPCDSTSSGWGAWQTMSSSKPYETWSSASSALQSWMGVSSTSTMSMSSSSNVWYNWQSSSSTSSSSSSTITTIVIPTTSTSTSSSSTSTTSLTTSLSSITTVITTISTSTTVIPTTSVTTTAVIQPTASAFFVEAVGNTFVPNDTPGVLLATGNGDQQYVQFVFGATPSALGLDSNLYLINPINNEYANIVPGGNQVFFNSLSEVNTNNLVRIQCTNDGNVLDCVSGIANAIGGTFTDVNNLFNLDPNGVLYLSQVIPAGNSAVTLQTVTI